MAERCVRGSEHNEAFNVPDPPKTFLMTKPVLFWFRNDLRLHDHPALQAALASGAPEILPVYCHGIPDECSVWGFARVGRHRRHWTDSAVGGLATELQSRGSSLVQCQGDPREVIPVVAHAVGATDIFCEAIAAPYEEADVQGLRKAGLTVHTVWQSSLLNPGDLPFNTSELPDSFTAFRGAVERAGVAPPEPWPRPVQMPTCPSTIEVIKALDAMGAMRPNNPSRAVKPVDHRASLPYTEPAFSGSEKDGLAHLDRYLKARLPHTYKATRNNLTGIDYSSKWSAWLATGALSAREIFARLRRFEDVHGANEGTYWLWFELLWRDYFRFLHLQYGARLYRKNGLTKEHGSRKTTRAQVYDHDEDGFRRWCDARTGEPLVDAAMHELQTTGFLSNRLRQIVASYLIYEINGDWRAGAAWFESQLLDFDPYSNQANWLYIAGKGTDPRGGRRFNIQKQARQYDPDGAYVRLWSRA